MYSIIHVYGALVQGSSHLSLVIWEGLQHKYYTLADSCLQIADYKKKYYN